MVSGGFRKTKAMGHVWRYSRAAVIQERGLNGRVYQQEPLRASVPN